MQRFSLFTCLLVGTLAELAFVSTASAQTPTSAPVVIRSLGGSRSITITGGLSGLGYGGMSKGAAMAVIQQQLAAGAGELLADEGDEEDEPEQKPIDPQFMQLFQQALLDRRPSTILAEWSKPEPLPSADDPKLKDPEEPEKIEDAPAAPVAPTKPTMPEGLVEPTAPEDVVSDVSGLGDLLALAKKKDEAAEVYAEQIGAWETAQAAHETAMAEFETAQADFEASQKTYAPLKKAYDKKKKKYDKTVAEWTQAKAKNKQKRLQRDVALFQRNVSLGRWDEVGETIESLGKKMAKAQYAVILGKIGVSPQPVNGQFSQFQEQPHFEFDDIVQVISIAPEGFDNKKANLIAPLVKRVFAQGHSLDDWLERLRVEVERPEEERVIDRRLAALLLTAQRYNLEMGEFLPTFDEAVADDDRQGLNLLARNSEARHKDTPKPEILGEAWEATLAVLAPGKIDEDDLKKDKAEALKRAVDLAGRVRDAKGDAWLRETFTDRPQRGMEVIATIGGEASKNMVTNGRNTTARSTDLELLHGAINALLEIAPERAEEWRETLTLSADIWLREAAHSFNNAQQTSMGSSSRRDSYGNIYWYEDSYNYDRYVRVQPIEPSELLDMRPDGAWRSALPASLRPKIDQTIAELYLKVSEEIEAYPYIKDLAGPEPDKANELAKTFLEVWLKNNDPNSSRNRSSIYNFSYGFNQRASGIPLTRSRQDRNLKDLTHWVDKLREIEGLELDSDLLMRAFTQCHSEAEVYRVEILEEVFGDLESLEPKTLASMTQKMRANLATIWRTPAAQKAAKTGRKQKDIEVEVQRGYEIAQALLARALEAHPESWRLKVVRGAMLHDLNNYRNDLQKSSDFTGSRREALGVLEEAADTYVASIPELRTDEYSLDAFQTWFNASMGASDIQAVTESTLLARNEIPKITALLEGIDGEAGEKHLSMFANMLFTRLSAVNPACKNRYLEAGFGIVGDHPQAKEARRVYDYYKDLVTEIELLATLDGDSDVGTKPFGVKVDIRYTKEIGRESGGFSRYLQNQANAVNYYYNNGRPQENYRDKFEEAVRTLLSEQFEVMSVTFNREDAASKADDEFGWRKTAYAYILLKAKGPQVDRVPPLKIDLDFNDVTGYVVLPITSPVVPIDASTEDPAVRPYKNLQLTQILDERRSDDGVLIVEVKAQAEGVVPDLEDIAEIAPKDFEVRKTEPQDVSVARFADDEEGVMTERIWMVELGPKEGVVNPRSFAFAAPKSDDIQTVYQRYEDADLMEAQPVVDLTKGYVKEKGFGWRWLSLIPAFLVVVFMLRIVMKAGDEEEFDGGPQMPTDITPVSVLGLLGDLRMSPRIDAAGRQSLDAAVLEIEQHYFRDADGKRGSAPDLASIARDWLGRVS